MFAEDHSKYKTKKDTFIYVAVNAHWEEHIFEMPEIPNGFTWKKAFDSNGFSSDAGRERKLDDQRRIILGPRTTMILVGVK